VESQTTLVRAESRVELNSVTSVDLELSLVILPGDSELDDSLGDLDDLEGLGVFGVLLQEGGEGTFDFRKGLFEFGLGGQVGHVGWMWIDLVMW
jgi:hypothetical protein